MKYLLDSELMSLKRHKVPANLKIMPVLNMVSSHFKCESDDKIIVSEYTIAGYGGADLSTLIIEPRAAKTKLPCLVYFHGGGFMLKATAVNQHIVKEYAEQLPCKVVYVDYRLAPDNPFPIAVEDCFSAYRWALNNIGLLQVDADKIMLGGDSAGGNLAIGVTLMARDRGLCLPSKVMLIYPTTDRRMQTESMKKYTDTPVWDARLSKMMWEAYLREPQPKHIEYASPIEAPSLASFPKTYMEVAEFDCLHDEGIAFYERLKEYDTDVELYEVKGACHGFENVFDSRITRQCMKRRIEWLRLF